MKKILSRLNQILKNYFFKLSLRFQFKSDYEKPVISILREFYPPPYGGGNQFMLYILKNLRSKGYRVKLNSFDKNVNIFIADYCWFNDLIIKKFLKHKNKFNSKLIHRIDGLLSSYREDGDPLDKKAQYINRYADISVIQSLYTLEQFKDNNYEFKNEVIIYNSVDKKIFYPSKRKNRIIQKIISASWSNNVQKGMNDYLWLDQNLAFGKYKYEFVGRLNFEPKNILLTPPLQPKYLAQKFREADLFIFCAMNESCSNVLLEAIECGIPVICKNSGANPEIIGNNGLLYNNVIEIPNLIEEISSRNNLFRKKKKLNKNSAFYEYLNLVESLKI